MKKNRADEIVRLALAMAGEEASEAESIIYSPRCTILATLPHSDPGDAPFFFRKNGEYGLYIQPAVDIEDDNHPRYLGYPYGSIPRLILAWLTAEAVRTKSRVLGLGNHMADFLRELGLGRHGGPRGDITRLRDQMLRLFGSRVAIRYYGKKRKQSDYFQVVDSSILWWDPEQPQEETRQHRVIILGEAFYKEIIDRPVPLDMRVIKALRRSPLALDIYSWLTYRMSYLKKPTLIPWASLQLQFGGDYGRARDFKKKFLEQLGAVKALYPHACFSTDSEKGLLIYPSRPQVLPKPS